MLRKYPLLERFYYRRDIMQKFKKIENITIDEENKRFKMDKVVVPNSKKRGCLSKFLLISITNIFYPFFKKGGKKNTDWFSFDDLVSYELIQNDDVVVTGGVGKAVVGGAVMTALAGGLWGMTGAVVGGVTGKRKQSKKVNSLAIRITLNSFDFPCCFIYLIEKPIKSNSKEYKNVSETAQLILSTLDLITHHKG